MAYRCATCGKVHDDLPDVGFGKPDYWFDVPEAERPTRCRFTPDTCEIDGEHFFVRGVIRIPVLDTPRDFGIGAWASLKKENFQIYLDSYDSNQIGPFFGWLCNKIPQFSAGDGIKTMVHFQGKKQRPFIVLEPTEEPLAVAQRDGIRLEEAWKIVHAYLKPSGPTSSGSFVTREHVNLHRRKSQMNSANECASSGAARAWDQVDWPQCEHHVRRIQARIVKATREGRWHKVKALQWLLTHSFSGRALAVKRVTDNKGKRTPGVDGRTWQHGHAWHRA